MRIKSKVLNDAKLRKWTLIYFLPRHRYWFMLYIRNFQIYFEGLWKITFLLLYDCFFFYEALLYHYIININHLLLFQSNLPGFYDPCLGEEKSLLVDYSYRSITHSITVKDNELLRIPKECKHKYFQQFL